MSTVARAPVIELVIDQNGAVAGAAALVGELLVNKAVLQRKAARRLDCLSMP
jgi:hypothetical protein